MDLKNFGRFITQLRKEKSLTQKDIADQLGVSNKTVSKWENGIVAPDISLLNDLSSILGITSTELLNGQKCNDLIKKDTADKIMLQVLHLYNKVDKLKMRKIFILFSVIIFSIIASFFIFFTINNYNKCFLYSIISGNENVQIEGIIAINQNKNKIIINKINYSDPYVGTNLEEKIKSLKITLQEKNKTIFTQEYTEYEQNLSNSLSKISINISETNNYHEYILNKKNIKLVTLIIQYTTTKDEIKNITVPLDLVLEFSNNKIMYD